MKSSSLRATEILLRCVESAALVAFAMLTGLSFYRLFAEDLWFNLVLTGLSLPIAFYLADLFSGLVHWVCDSFGSETTPIWGPMLVGPFRRHHRTPLQITQISLVENLGASAMGGSLLLVFWRPAVGAQGLLWHLYLWFLFFSFLSNLFHRWAHWPRAQKPRWLVFLQKRHIVLNSDEHLQHHRKPHRVNYCILSGWANGLTNRVPWHRLEAMLLRIGIRAHFEEG